MLNLINTLTTQIKGTVKFPEWNYIQQGLSLNLDSANKYYRNGAYAVGSDHELIKLIFGLSLSTDMELNRFYNAADNKGLTVAQQLGYTTTMSKGRIFNNVFFGGNSREVIIVTDEPFDPVEVTKDWKNARPIRILKHGFDTIDCFLLNGKVKSNGLSVFAINLPMLAVQYRAYRQWQKSYVTEETGRNSIYHFCYAYPINNMIFEAMDHSVFNRVVRLNQGQEPSDNVFQHPFHVTNFTGRCDRILEMVLAAIKNQKRDIGNIAMTIPLVSHLDAFKLLKLPDIAESRQVNWAIYLARIDMLLFYLSFDGVEKFNQSQMSKLKYSLSLYLKDGTIQSAVPSELFQKQKIVIEELIKKL